MVAFSVLLLFVSVVSILAKPAPRLNPTVKRQEQVIPSGFALKGPASLTTILTLRMALTSDNLSGLETALYDVSTPGNRLYGQHLTKDEVESYIAPSAETKSAVEGWLNTNSIQATIVSPAGDWLSFTIPVSKANELFNANFSVFTEQTTGSEVVRTFSYSIPDDLKGHVNLVHPTTTFPIRSVNYPIVTTSEATAVPTSDGDVPASCASSITPACLQALYGLPSTVGPQNASQIGVPGFSNQFAQEADLADFLQKFRPDLIPPPTFAFQSIDGGQNIQDPTLAGDEANLDIQYTVGLAGGVPVTFFSVGDSTAEGFSDFIHTLIAEPNPPQVVSVSYAFDEADLPNDFSTQLCNAVMQLGARGVSILFSTGDYGVSGARPGTFCFDFVPTFPSTCPYVTSVGATRGINPEAGSTLSAGGFSNVFSIPDYQKSAVSSYLAQLGSTYDGLFNTSGRGFPDVSAQGEFFNIFNASVQVPVSGTSASTPTVSSLIAQVNALRLQKGNSVLGFLNPLIYNATGLFTDITSGNNPGCFTNGFSAAPGWDPITGLGTPIFSGFESLP